MRALVGTQFQCGHGRNVAAFENDLSRRWLNQSIEQTDKRRLAGTGETHDNENLARLDAETDVVDCHHVSRLLEISFRPRPCLISSAARSGFGPKIFDRFLTVRISVPETAMGFATAETSSALIAPGWTTPSGANVRFGVILSSQKASTKNRSARLVILHSPCTRRPRSPWPHTSASFMTELSAQSRGQTS
ncbi:hypothetical protein P3T23_002507 [Paraburkholderia sp. GAS448]